MRRRAKAITAAGIFVLAAGSGHAATATTGHHHRHHGHAAHVSLTGNVALGERLAADRGWTGSQWDCLYTLWQGESGWRNTADTRASGLDPAGASVFAYGIPQSRPATKMPHSAWPPDLGGNSDPEAQIRWGLDYINGTYGSPCSALAAKRASGNKGY